MQVGCVLCGSLCLFFRQEEYVSGKIGIPGIGDSILIMVNGMGFPCLFILLFPAGDLCGIGKDAVRIPPQYPLQGSKLHFPEVFLGCTELGDDQGAFVDDLVCKFIRDAVFTVRAKGICFGLYPAQHCIMLFPQDGFYAGFRFRDVLHDDLIVVQDVLRDIIKAAVPEDQGGQHQDEQDREHQKEQQGAEDGKDGFTVFPRTDRQCPIWPGSLAKKRLPSL